MKLTLVLLVVGCLQVSANKAYSQKDLKLTLDLSSVKLKKAFEIIEKGSKYRFLYNSNTIPENVRVDLHGKDIPIADVLDKLIRDNGLIYKVINDKVIAVTSAGEMMQTIHVQGNVSDSTGKPLQGVNVTIAGQKRGTQTDAKGHFEMDVPDDAVLEISSVGYQSQEVRVSGAMLQIVLKESSNALNQVVVVGYGTRVKEADLTGSVARLGGDKLENRPVTGTLDAIQGLVPGVQVTRSSGQPGSQGFQIAIRGASSINGNVPLVLIDGIPGDLSLINPQDIQDLTVLKDATAAIYGARAADGVVLVTTKRGKKSSKPNIAYSFNGAIKKPGMMKRATSTDHFVKMFNEANKNDGDPQTFSDETLAKVAANDPGVGPGENWGVQSFPMFYQSRDWYGSLFKSSFRPTHNVSVSGGGENSAYVVSFGDTRDNGNISKGPNASVRDNLRIDLQTNLLKNLRLDLNTAYDYLNIKQPSQLNDAINNGVKMFSYLPVYNPAGNYYGYQGYENPFQELTMGGLETIVDSRWSNNIKLDFEPIKGLVWTGQMGINIERFDDNANFPTNIEHNWDNTPNSLIRNNPNKASYWNWGTVYKNFSTYINYNKTFGKHDIRVMAGASREKFTRQEEQMNGADFSSNTIFTLPLSDARNLRAGANNYWNNNPWALESYFGRAAYSYDGKYYIEGTLRKDGSSKFSPDKRWSEIYPSVSAAWKISGEEWFRNLLSNDIVNLFKLRASWGKTGNQDLPTLGFFDYIQLININGQYPIDGSTVSRLASLRGIASPDRTWETIETKNLGVDLSLFRSRLSVSFDVFRKNNNNMLVSITYPSTLGASAPTSNAGSLLSKGWEFNGQWNDKIGNVRWNLGVILNYNTNTITDLQGQDTYNLGLTQARQGFPLNSYFGYKGSVIRSQAQLDAYASKYAGKGIVPATTPNGYGGLGVGDMMYEDIDGDGQITTYGDKTKGKNGDAVFLGSQIPKITYSVTGGLKYKGFDFSFILQGTGDKYVWRGNGNFGVPLSHSWFQPLDYFYGKVFSPTNTGAMYPRISNNSTVKNNNYAFSNRWLENTRYLRMKNLTLGYTFNELQIKDFKIHGIRIYVSGQDLFEFAKGTWDKMYDPEETRVPAIGQDANNFDYYENNYPMYRTFSFGVNVNF
ncbi:MAG: TonB-dependent receptor [Bacteroidetes bacterium]|nr:TonB-dependent receptor [Bacteroidota bacterium]